MQRKTIIALIALLVLMASLLGISAGAETAAQNGYDAAVRNGDLYFVLPGAAGDALVYVPQNGQAAVLTHAGEISDLTPYNGDLICLATTNDASAILRISGTQVSTLYPFGTERADDLMVHGNQLLVRSDHLLYTIDPSNNVRMKLSGAQMDQYVLEGDNAYYIAESDQIQYGAEGTDTTVQAGCIYRLNLQTGENALLLKSGAENLHVLSGNLYFHNMADAYAADDAVRGHIYRFAIDRQTLESVTAAPDQGLWVIDSGAVALQDGALMLYGAGNPVTLYQPAENAVICCDGERMYIWAPDAQTLTEVSASGAARVLSENVDLAQVPDIAELATPEPSPEATIALDDGLATADPNGGDGTFAAVTPKPGSGTSTGFGDPTAKPTSKSTAKPTAIPSGGATAKPTAKPTTKPTLKPTAKPTAKPTTKPTDNSYIFPNSRTKYLTEADILKVDRSLWALGRNEIYARHGYIFSNKTYANYFAKKAWYTPGGFSRGQLNAIEWYNMDLIKEMEARYPNGKPSEVRPTDAPVQPTNTPEYEPWYDPRQDPDSSDYDPNYKPGSDPTAKPTAAPTAKPTAAPTAAPTEAPTPAPTAAPTAAPEPEPEPEPEPDPAGEGEGE